MASSDTDVTLTIGGNASGAVAAGAEAKEAVVGVGASVKEAGAAFALMGESAVAALERIVLGASSARTAMVEFGASIKEAKDVVNEIGEAMIAAFAVEKIVEFAKSMGETAEATAHTAETFGLTTAQVQAMKAQAAGAGVPFEALATGMMRLDRAFLTAKEGATAQTEAFKALGISTIEPLTQTQLLQRTLNAFGGMDAGPAKVALAMQLFGRNIQALGPLLNMTKEQLDENAAQVTAYGAVSDDAAGKGLALAESFNTQHVAAMGMGNVLTSTFAPAFKDVVDDLNAFTKSVIESYNAGGAWREFFEAAGQTASTVGAIISAFGTVVADVFGVIGTTISSILDVVNTLLESFGLKAANAGEQTSTLKPILSTIVVAWLDFAAAVESVIITVGSYLKTAAEAFRGFARIAYDALHGDFGAIGADWKSGLAAIVASSTDAAGKVGKAWQDAQDKIAHLNSEADKAKLPKEGTGTTAQDPNGKPKAGESQVGKWTQELHQDEIDAANASGDFMKDQSELEMAFWQSKLALTTTNSKSWYEIQARIFELTKAAQTSAYNSLIAGDKEKIAADSNNHTAWLADWDKYLADVARAYPDDTAKYKEALAEKAKAEADYDKEIVAQRTRAIEQQKAATEKGLTDNLAATKASISEQIAAIKEEADGNVLTRAAMWQKIEALQAQETAAEVAAAKARYQAEITAAQQIAALKPLDVQATQDSINAQYAAWVAYHAKLAQLSAQGMQAMVADQKAAVQQMQQTVQPFVTSWTSGMLEMAEGTKSFASVMRQIGQQMLNDILNVIDRMIAKWIAKELTQTTASTMGNAQRAANDEAVAAVATVEAQMQSQGEITAAAAVAAANTFASISAIPVVGPAMAPEAAAAAMAAVNAFRVSAAGGYDIPSGVNPVAQLHAEEMVLPAHIANPLRTVLASPNGASALAGSAGAMSGGDTHVHIHANDADSVKQMFERNGAHLVSVIKRQLGNGALLGAKR